MAFDFTFLKRFPNETVMKGFQSFFGLDLGDVDAF